MEDRDQIIDTVYYWASNNNIVLTHEQGVSLSNTIKEAEQEARLSELELMPHEAGCASLNPTTGGDCSCYKARRAEEIKKNL